MTTTIGQRIKQARKQSGLTSVELARRLGRPQSFVATYETNARNPKDETIKEFAKILNVNYAYLKYGSIDNIDPELVEFIKNELNGKV